MYGPSNVYSNVVHCLHHFWLVLAISIISFHWLLLSNHHFLTPHAFAFIFFQLQLSNLCNFFLHFHSCPSDFSHLFHLLLLISYFFDLQGNPSYLWAILAFSLYFLAHQTASASKYKEFLVSSFIREIRNLWTRFPALCSHWLSHFCFSLDLYLMEDLIFCIVDIDFTLDMGDLFKREEASHD